MISLHIELFNMIKKREINMNIKTIYIKIIIFIYLDLVL